MTGYESKRAAAQDKLDSMEREALKLALEALEQTLQTLDDENSKPGGAIADTIWHSEHETLFDYLGSEITAIKEALAQPKKEPLEYWNAVEGWVKVDEVREHFDSVGCGTIYKTAGEDRVPLYTTPPQRQPLTDEQIEDIAAKTMFPINFARAIEAAHGIKENT